MGATAGALLTRYLSPVAQRQLADAFAAGRTAEVGRVVAFFAALHDLGKASAWFGTGFESGRFTPARVRKEHPRWAKAARAAGLPLPTSRAGLTSARHEHITAALLPRLCGCDCADFTWGERCWELRHKGLHEVAACLAQHHGHFPNSDTVARAYGAGGGDAWLPVQDSLVAAVAEATGVERDRLVDLVGPEIRPAALVTFAGLVVLADWIGSDETRFRYARLAETDAEWWATARTRADDAVTALRLDRWRPTTDATWAQLWPGTEPRRFQADAMRLMPEQGPALVIVESDTGSGKTRLALWCAHHLAVRNGYQGLYLALPTRAATTQAAQEVREFMRTALDAEAANLSVVHSTAFATDLVHELLDASVAPEIDAGGLGALVDGVDATYDECAEQDRASAPAGFTPERGRAVLDPWYLRRCLGLIAPFGVGTIDQVVLAAQRSRHWTLRMLGLSGKTVVIDEAHAYELYQQEVLGAAIEWLADAGASVVILSATLPASVRTALSAAWCRGLRVTATDTGTQGPITVIDDTGSVRRGGPAPDEADPLHTTIRLEPEGEPEDLAARLLADARDGGCVAVIRTRVAPAVKLYEQARRLATSYGWSPDEVILLHGRFMPRDRQPVEDELARVLGPGDREDRKAKRRNRDRPHRRLVIATDVLGQSLDIDFDHMVCDLAPIDLLIQRRGRVHRHAADNDERPARYAEPALTVLYRPDPTDPDLPQVEPPPERGLPGNPDGYVYAPYPLAATFRTLHSHRREDNRIRITTPLDSESLLESVYGERQTANGPMGALLDRTWHTWQAALENEHRIAEGLMLRPYHPDHHTAILASDLASGRHHGDGGTGGVEGIQAISRLGEASVPLVCLYRQTDNTFTYDPAGTLPADLHHYTSSPTDLPSRRAQQRNLLLNTLAAPAGWFRGPNALPLPDTESDPNRPALHHTHVLYLTPDGHPLATPAGRLGYAPETGLRKT